MWSISSLDYLQSCISWRLQFGLIKASVHTVFQFWYCKKTGHPLRTSAEKKSKAFPNKLCRKWRITPKFWKSSVLEEEYLVLITECYNEVMRTQHFANSMSCGFLSGYTNNQKFLKAVPYSGHKPKTTASKAALAIEMWDSGKRAVKHFLKVYNFI